MSLTTAAWDLEVDDAGTRLPSGYRSLVRSLRVEASVDGADEVVIEADARDTVDGTWRILSETILQPGSRVVVLVGWADTDLVAQGRFRLARLETVYRDGGASVTLRGYSAEADLAEGKAARSWPAGTTYTDAVIEVAEAYGLDVSLVEASPATPTSPLAKKAGTSDLEWLRSVAGALEYGEPIVRYDRDSRRDRLVFRPTRLADQGELVTFRFLSTAAGPGGTLVEFAPEYSLAGVPSKVEVIGWDPVEQESIVVVVEITDSGEASRVLRGTVATVDESIRSGSGLRVKMSNDGGGKEAREVVVNELIETTDAAQEWASRWLRTRNLAYQTARARVIGYERLWVGQIVRIEGVAPVHEGLWEIVRCEHDPLGGDGYFCNLDLRRVLEDLPAPSEAA